MFAFGGRRSNRHAHHPPPVQHRRRQIRLTRQVQHRSTQPSVCRSSASPANPGGSCRTQMVCKGTGAKTRPVGSRTYFFPQTISHFQDLCEAAPASRQPLVRVSTATIFNARNRRPSGNPQSRRFFHAPIRGRLQVAPGSSTSPAPDVPRRGRNTASNQTLPPATYER